MTTTVLMSSCVVNITGPMSWDVGSDPRALTEVLTGAQSGDCVPLGAKVGDVVMLENGDMAEVKSVSANKTRCTNPQRPVAANIQRKTGTVVQTNPATPSVSPTLTSSSLLPSISVAPMSVDLKFSKLCEGLGFQQASAGFASCVKELVDREGSIPAPATADSLTESCRKLGFKEGTAAYTSCMTELDARIR